MQAKDIPDRVILDYLRQRPGVWHTWYDDLPADSMPTIARVTPGVPAQVRLAKMRSLIRRGLVQGCTCGCRGDFYVEDGEQDGDELLASALRAGVASGSTLPARGV